MITFKLKIKRNITEKQSQIHTLEENERIRQVGN